MTNFFFRIQLRRHGGAGASGTGPYSEEHRGAKAFGDMAGIWALCEQACLQFSTLDRAQHATYVLLSYCERCARLPTGVGGVDWAAC